jgi:hypothetical protein
MPDLGGLDAELWLLYPLLRTSRLSSVSSFSHDKRWRRDFIGATERQNNDPRWRNLFLSISYELLLSPGISARPCHEMLGEPHIRFLPSPPPTTLPRRFLWIGPWEKEKRDIEYCVCVGLIPTIYTTPHSFFEEKKKTLFFFCKSFLLPLCGCFFNLQKENCNTLTRILHLLYIIIYTYAIFFTSSSSSSQNAYVIQVFFFFFFVTPFLWEHSSFCVFTFWGG